MPGKRRKQIRTKGQSIVEAALILPIIMLIFMGIIDFGLLFNNYMIIENASREGARYAAVGNSDSDVTAVINNATTFLDRTKLTTTIYPSQSMRKKGDEISVTVEYENNLFTPIISAIVPNPVRLKGRTVMRME